MVDQTKNKQNYCKMIKKKQAIVTKCVSRVGIGVSDARIVLAEH